MICVYRSGDLQTWEILMHGREKVLIRLGKKDEQMQRDGTGETWNRVI